ncbi:MAG: DUF4091 domain-containing protein [Bacteroidota bacterium]|nr:DUF4091 domain-containing protein [Bacteroidota bacterium]
MHCQLQAQKPSYGYLLGNNDKCTFWWAEGAYKVMLNDSPFRGHKNISLQMASNETEPFQLIVKAKQPIYDLRISLTDVKDKNGNKIVGFSTEILNVEYVSVTVPTDSLAKTGLYPDPAPRYNGPVKVDAGINHPFWINIKTDKEVKAGDYVCDVKIEMKGWSTVVPVHIKVWNFTLPETPNMRSSFGINTDFIRRYHHLDSNEEIRNETDKYYRFMAEHRIAPTSPMDLYPMRVNVTGLKWTSGIYERQKPHDGHYCLKIDDNSVTDNVETETVDFISVNDKQTYDFSFYARTLGSPHEVTAYLETYDAGKQFLPFSCSLETFDTDSLWKVHEISKFHFPDNVKFIKVRLCPAFRDESGNTKGTACFDDVTLTSEAGKTNLIPCGDFEVDPDKIDVNVDFSEFDKGGQLYLDSLKFNAFNLSIMGMGSGTYYSHNDGIFYGFIQDTPEYEKLMSKYLRQIQDHLEQKGWLGKEYIYWFDEPGEKDYPFVRKGMMSIHKAAPKLTRFITENEPGPAIMDVTEMSCVIWNRIKPEIVTDLSKKGREFWSYICCGPKAPWINEFIEHDAVNMRMWLWMSYQYKLKGILIWNANYWNSTTASPDGYLQNPWENPMSYVVGYGFAKGKIQAWGNGDGRYIYPPKQDPNNDHRKNLEEPVTSIRLEILREGMEDYDYFKILEKLIGEAPASKKALATKASRLLYFDKNFFINGETYSKDPQILLDRRAHIAMMIEKLSNN